MNKKTYQRQHHNLLSFDTSYDSLSVSQFDDIAELIVDSIV